MASSTTSAALPALLKNAAIIAPKVTHKSTLIWLHGLGDSSDGFESTLAMLPFKNLRVVLPNAPIRPVTVNMGMRMQAWYDIVDMGRTEALADKQDVAGIKQSAEAIAELLDYESTSVSSERIILGGFSQGGAMSLYTGLHYPKKLGGIVSCSGYLLQHTAYPDHLSAAGKLTPVWAYHGTSDNVVPYPYASKGYELLQSSGANLSFQSEKGLGHSLSNDEFMALIKWIREKLDKQ